MSTQTTTSAGSVPEFTIGDRLRKSREHAGLDQDDLAREIGVSRGTIRNYESGATSHLKPIVLRAWALRCGVPLDWIMGTGSGATAKGPHPAAWRDEDPRMPDRSPGRTRTYKPAGFRPVTHRAA